MNLTAPIQLPHCPTISNFGHKNISIFDSLPRTPAKANRYNSFPATHRAPYKYLTMAEAPPKDPITCHVLDTTIGRPAPHIKVKLFNPTSNSVFEGTTNGDGRIANWSVRNGDAALKDTVQCHGGVRSTLEFMIKKYARKEGDENEGPEMASCPAGSSIWSLEFDTGGYYGYTNTFFPKVDLTFLVKEGQHYHVPLLLGPYSFTTYRGS